MSLVGSSTSFTDYANNVASLSAGSGVVVTAVDNSSDGYLAAIVTVRIRSGTAPTAGGTYDIYLVRSDDATSQEGDDNWDETDGSFTRVNAPLLGSIVVTNDANTDFVKTFDTWNVGALGPKWGIAVVNNTDQTTNATSGNHKGRYRHYTPDAVS